MSDPRAATTEPVPGGSSVPITVGPDVLKRAMRHHAAGVAIVTADVGDGPIALTISSLTSVSVEPAILLFSVSGTTDTGRALARATSVVVHLLEDADHDLAVRCATPGSDRFVPRSLWEQLPSGEPAFVAPRVRLRGAVVQRDVFGDSTVMVVAVTDVTGSAVASPEEHERRPGALAYHDRSWHALGPWSMLDDGHD